VAIEILWLTGRSGAEAVAAADEKLDLSTGPPDLRKLLVVDDSALLAAHATTFNRLLSRHRVENLLCVAVGPRPDDSAAELPGEHPLLRLPPNLAGAHESGVLWVGDPDGIDWRAAAGARVLGHPRGSANGQERLVELLLIEEVFTRVYETYVHQVPNRVASPGLRLVGADDQAAVFKAALAMAIRRLTEPGDDAPAVPLRIDAGKASLAAGDLASRADAVAESVRAARAAVEQSAKRRFRRGDAGVAEHVRAAGAALVQLRDLVAGLLQSANTTSELTGDQRDLLQGAGVQLPPASWAKPQPEPDDQERVRPPSYAAVTRAFAEGDPLPLIEDRLDVTQEGLRRRGSASYLPEVDELCPAWLLEQLAGAVGGQPAAARRDGTDALGRDLGLDAAAEAATRLVGLVLTVASREWSLPLAAPDELELARMAIRGIRKKLTEFEAGAADVRSPWLTRLSDSLTPTLRDLALRVLADEYDTPSSVGQEAVDAAERRTGRLLGEWEDLVAVGDVSARPKYATTRADVVYAVETDVAAIREALLAAPGEQMWQLCGQDDVTALDTRKPPLAVRFAPSLNQNQLADIPQSREIRWLSSGGFAGLLRLVPLHREIISWEPDERTAGTFTDPDPEAAAAAPESW
jgi:hypothetical protein